METSDVKCCLHRIDGETSSRIYFLFFFFNLFLKFSFIIIIFSFYESQQTFSWSNLCFSSNFLAAHHLYASNLSFAALPFVRQYFKLVQETNKTFFKYNLRKTYFNYK